MRETCGNFLEKSINFELKFDAKKFAEILGCPDFLSGQRKEFDLCFKNSRFISFQNIFLKIFESF